MKRKRKEEKKMKESIMPRPKYGTQHAKIITVIRTVSITGTGTEDDPVRREISYWKPDGTLIATKEITSSDEID